MIDIKLSEISKTLLFHYVPAWLTWSGIFCIVFSSLQLPPGFTFAPLFLEVQAQTLFVYLFILGALFCLRPSVNPFRLAVVFSAMVCGVLCWEYATVIIRGGNPMASAGSGFYPGYVVLRLFCGCFIVWCFLLAERYCLSERLLRKQKINRLLEEKKLTRSEIRYLKSRIDPALLFSELEEILSLRETNPAGARFALHNLVRRLRETLSKTKMKGSPF